MPRDTVFSPAFGNRPSRLVGRDKVVAALMAGLDARPGSRDRAVLLIGQRGSGKTVLLWEIADRARERGYVVASPTVASDDMLERIVEKIQDDGERFVKAEPRHMTGGNVGVLGFSAGLQFEREVQETKSFQYKLARLCSRLGERGHGVLILVDEVQANSPDIRKLVAAYQELVGAGMDVALVMAGLPSAVSATLNDRVLTFLNRARKVTLAPLAIGDVDAYLAQAFLEVGVWLDDDSRQIAAQATQGSPYLLQLIGHYLVLYSGVSAAVTPEALENAIRSAQADFENDVCETTLAALSDRDADFLVAMAQDSGSSRMADIAERMGVTPDYAQKYRKRLIDAGVVRVPRRGSLEFAVPYLAEHLRRQQLAL